MKRFLYFVAALASATLGACGGGPIRSAIYSVKAYAPNNPDNVSVKVSTSTQHIYVMEGDRLLMAVQGCVGANGSTPTGSYRIFNKMKTKRRVSEPDAGYPMAYWCEFKPAYGFHEGFVWGIPRTHGCIRMHREAAARLFALVKVGTPVHIATTQAEDAKYGAQVRKLDQRNDPDPPRSLLMSPQWFRDPPGTLLIKG
jgi:L,D-transpeptidase catalytic domain